MSFETPQKSSEKAQEVGTQLHELVTNNVRYLEEAIRWMGPHEREMLYMAVEKSKTANTPLVR
jgi:hypothetical protein